MTEGGMLQRLGRLQSWWAVGAHAGMGERHAWDGAAPMGEAAVELPLARQGGSGWRHQRDRRTRPR